jgi:hypothetical protein
LLSYLLHASAEFWTAWFTLGLLVAAIFGLAGINTAAQAYKLEALPTLTFSYLTYTDTVGKNPLKFVVSKGWRGTYGPSLRPITSVFDEHNGGLPNLTLTQIQRELHTTIWPSTAIAIRNVGRSPAIDVDIGVLLSFQPRVFDYAEMSQNKPDRNPWEVGRDFPHPKPADVDVRSELTLASIMPEETVVVTIENRYAAEIMLTFDDNGTAVDRLNHAKRIQSQSSGAIKEPCWSVGNGGFSSPKEF